MKCKDPRIWAYWHLSHDDTFILLLWEISTVILREFVLFCTYPQLPIWSISTWTQFDQDRLHPALWWMQDLESCPLFPSNRMIRSSSGLQRRRSNGLESVGRQLCRCASLSSLCICRLTTSTLQTRWFCHNTLNKNIEHYILMFLRLTFQTCRACDLDSSVDRTLRGGTVKTTKTLKKLISISKSRTITELCIF